MYRPQPHEKKVFLNFLLSYLLLLSIPLAVGFYAYGKTVDVLEESAVDLNTAVLNQTKAVLDGYFLEIEEIASSMALDAKIRRFFHESAPLTDRDYYRIHQIIEEMPSDRLNQMIVGFFVYFKKSDAIVTSRTLYHLPEDYGGFFRYETLDVATWLDLLTEGSTNKKILPAAKVMVDGHAREVIAYVRSIPTREASPAGAIVIYMDAHEVRKLFQPLVENGGWGYILDGQDRLMIGTSSDLPMVDLAAFEKSGYFHHALGGQEMVITYETSDLNGWKYVSALPSRVVLSKAHYINKITAMVVAAGLVLGSAIALWLAYRHSRPIRALVATLRETAGSGNTLYGNVYDLIEDSIRDLISSNKSLKFSVEKQIPFLQAAFYERLLWGRFSSESELLAVMHSARLEMDNGPYLAVIIRMNGYGGWPSEAVLRDIHQKKRRIETTAAAMLGKTVHLYSMEENTLVLIIAGDSCNREDFLRIWKAKLAEIYCELNVEQQMGLYMGAGHVYEQLLDLWRSFDEAKQTLDHTTMMRKRGVGWYDEFLEVTDSYYYPLDLESRLMHTVKSGDHESVARLLHHIYEANFKKRSVPPAMTKQLVYAMKGTLFRMLAQLQNEPDTARFMAELERHDFESSGDSFEAICTLYEQASRLLCQQARSHNERLIEEMKAFVDEHFVDPDLSLSTMGEHFVLSESYISTFFKEQTGENFSVYLENKRMDKACEILEEENRPIHEIAAGVGYNSDKVFRRAFKRCIGIQPTAYRNQARKQRELTGELLAPSPGNGLKHVPGT